MARQSWRISTSSAGCIAVRGWPKYSARASAGTPTCEKPRMRALRSESGSLLALSSIVASQAAMASSRMSAGTSWFPTFLRAREISAPRFIRNSSSVAETM